MTKQPLKLVGPSPEVTTFEGYEPLLLASVEVLDIYWSQTAVHLQAVVSSEMHGEMTVEDIYDRVRAGTMYAAIFKKDEGELPSVALVLIMEIRTYPQYSVLNIVALGGHGLGPLMDKFWKHVCSWAFINGVRTIEASVSPVVARALRKHGFTKFYETVRLDLTEM